MPAPANLVHETTTVEGTGNATLAAVNGKQRFSAAFGTGATENVFYYFISNRSAAEWEIGTGHMSDANTLVRDTVILSSNGNAAVDFTAGTKDIANDIPAALQGKIIAARETLIADRTYYVRTDGNDGNDGLTDSSGGAFLTIQHALAVIAETIDMGGKVVTIQVGDGTRTSKVTVPRMVGQAGIDSLKIVGNPTTPANCVLSVTGDHCFTVGVGGAMCAISGFDLRTTTSGDCLDVAFGGQIRLDGLMIFGACAGNHISVYGGGLVDRTANYTINGNAQRHLISQGTGSFITGFGATITLTGTPAFSENFAFGTLGGNIGEIQTYSGAATGTRYFAYLNGVINTFGGGANYFPGNVAGSTSDGGQYA